MPFYRFRARGSTFPALLLLGTAMVHVGCEGFISDTGPGGGNNKPPVGRTEPVCDRPSCDVQVSFATSTAFPRLTHAQYQNTVSDLFGVDAASTVGTFTPDTRVSFFDNNAAVIRVSPELWSDYQRAAEIISDQVTANDAILDRITPAGLSGDLQAKSRTFVETFGVRAYRRPLTTQEVDKHVALFLKGSSSYPAMDAFKAGVRLTLEAMLQSPFFVYRVERSSKVTDGLVVLDGYEIANRMSYALLNTMPDAELFAAAANGDLALESGIETQTRRLLAEDRAKQTINDFHRQLLQWDNYERIAPDTNAFPEFEPGMGEDMQIESQRFVDHVIFEEEAGLNELLTAPYTFVNADLAAIYGFAGSFDDTFKKIDFDASERTKRSGILTQLGFLASNAGPTGAIHRGVFVNNNLLCTVYPGVRPTVFPPQPGIEGGNTWRDRIDTLTGEGTCGASCHVPYINAAGFAFENFDGIGKFRTQEFGYDVDASSEFGFYSGTVPIDGAVQFANEMASHFEAHDCYVRHWLEYAFGRTVAPADAGLVQRLGEASRDDLSVIDLIVELTKSTAFRTRAPEAT